MASRIPSAPARRVNRFVLACGVLFGIASVAYRTGTDVGFGADFRVYYFAVTDWLAGGPVYGIDVGTYAWPYLYAPVSLLLFLPLALFPTWESAFVAFTLVQIASGAVLARLVTTFLRRRGASVSAVDTVLLFLFLVGSVLTVGGIRNGNVNLYLTLLTATAAIWVYAERDVAASGLLVLASVIKVFVAFYGLWYVFKRRSRAVAGCFGFGAAAVAGSLAFGVEMNREFVRVLTTYSDSQAASGAVAPGRRAVTLLRPLSQLFDLPIAVLTVVATVGVACVVGYAASEATDVVGEMYLLFWILLTPTVVSFKEYLEFVVVPLVALLYLVEDSREHTVLALGSLLVFSNVGYEHYAVVVRFALESWPERMLLTLGESVLSFGSLPLYGISLLLLSTVYHHSDAVRRFVTVVGRSSTG